MTDQQYRVIADRDKGDDMESAVAALEDGDRVTYIYDTDPPDQVMRIERPVPTTGLPAPLHLTDAEADSSHAAMQEAGVPTREQIFDALNGKWFDDDWDSQINLDVTTAGQITDVVLALIQNGADR